MSSTGSASISRRQVLDRHKQVREDHLRYLEKWGVVRPEKGAHGERLYTFHDLALIRDADAQLAAGANFRAVLRSLLAARDGQLAFDFRIDARVAKVLRLTRREAPPMAVLMDPQPAEEVSTAEAYFHAASELDDGDPDNIGAASGIYRRALEVDPYLVPALINLANLHYSSNEIAEAQALYERAIALDPDIYEAHFNLGNIFHDLARFPEAQRCYREALRLNPAFADAHFYLAVTLEKHGQSAEARRHWKAYQQLAPQGEWVALAREFSEGPAET